MKYVIKTGAEVEHATIIVTVRYHDLPDRTIQDRNGLRKHYLLDGLRHLINEADDWLKVCREHKQYIYYERLSTIGYKPQLKTDTAHLDVVLGRSYQEAGRATQPGLVNSMSGGPW